MQGTSGYVASQLLTVFHFSDKDAACNHLMLELRRYIAFFFPHHYACRMLSWSIYCIVIIFIGLFIKILLSTPFSFGIHVGSLVSVVIGRISSCSCICQHWIPSPVLPPVTYMYLYFLLKDLTMYFIFIYFIKVRILGLAIFDPFIFSQFSDILC